MKIAWWWNNDYEQLMGNVTGWTEKHPNAKIQQTKFQISPDGKKFYVFILYNDA